LCLISAATNRKESISGESRALPFPVSKKKEKPEITSKNQLPVEFPVSFIQPEAEPGDNVIKLFTVVS
jgi:hypothetical protein